MTTVRATLEADPPATPEAVRVARELLDTEIHWSLGPLPEPAPLPAAEMIVEAVIDALAYRLLAVEAIDQNRDLTLQLDASRAECRRLRDAQRGPS